MSTHEAEGPSEGRSVDEQIAERILVQMFRRKMTHRTLAEKAGIGQSSWTYRMQGTRPWRAEEVLLVAAALGVDPSVLLPRLDSNQQPFD